MELTTQDDFIRLISIDKQGIWSGNVCGLACLHMITQESPDSILEWMMTHDGWDNKKGWKHSTMMQYLREKNYQVTQIQYRFFPTRILRTLKNKDSLLIASIGMSHGSHLVIVGYKDYNTIEIFDPGTNTYPGGIVRYSPKEFLKKWRKYGIIVTL